MRMSASLMFGMLPMLPLEGRLPVLVTCSGRTLSLLQWYNMLDSDPVVTPVGVVGKQLRNIMSMEKKDLDYISSRNLKEFCILQ